jgi:hypothetical protein
MTTSFLDLVQFWTTAAVSARLLFKIVPLLNCNFAFHVALSLSPRIEGRTYLSLISFFVLPPGGFLVGRQMAANITRVTVFVPKGDRAIIEVMEMDGDRPLVLSRQLVAPRPWRPTATSWTQTPTSEVTAAHSSATPGLSMSPSPSGPGQRASPLPPSSSPGQTTLSAKPSAAPIVVPSQSAGEPLGDMVEVPNTSANTVVMSTFSTTSVSITAPSHAAKKAAEALKLAKSLQSSPPTPPLRLAVKSSSLGVPRSPSASVRSSSSSSPSVFKRPKHESASAPSFKGTEAEEGNNEGNPTQRNAVVDASGANTVAFDNDTTKKDQVVVLDVDDSLDPSANTQSMTIPAGIVDEPSLPMGVPLDCCETQPLEPYDFSRFPTR